MPDPKLKAELRSMINQYGFKQVDRFLREIHLSDRQLEASKRHKASSNVGMARKPRKRQAKVTAQDYIAKMELPSEKKSLMIELAKRFQNKSFLPAFGDIRNFCQIYGIDEPASKSRASAIPRVFRFIVAMETNKAQRILDDGMFSGPSRLGPIADAIRRNGRAAAHTPTSTRDFFSSSSEVGGSVSEKRTKA